MTNNVNNKYICPLCGSSYSKVEELSACVARDAKAIKDKEARLKETETKTLALRKSIAKAKQEIEADVIRLRTKISNYNTMGRQLAALDPKSDVHCALSVSYSEKDSQVDRNEILSFIKDKWDDSTELNDLIDNIFNF